MWLARALGAILAVVSLAAAAIEPFVVRDIRVEGVQRTEPGTVFSYLPIKVGDRVTDQTISDAVKALYATGFFRDVRLEAQGNVLIVAVEERPTISSITYVGNKEFDTDTIKKAVKEIGLAEARIFDRAVLDRAEQELKRQYITRGKYSAEVQTTVTPQQRNRVAINFTIKEGDSAKIARINIVGARIFTEKQLLDQMTLTTPGWLTWYTKNDQYSKQKLSGDLEKLRSYYQDRGYLEMNIDSTQVSITPDKEQIYITVNITEGPRFTVGDVRIAGDLVVPASELEKLEQIKTGDVFSRTKLQASAKDMSDRLGSEGYAFANVNAVPEIDRKTAKASFTFYIDPGRRAYVRRINISGNAKTRDVVIRREFRQLEDAWYDTQRIDRSKTRVKRLGYFDDVNIETPPVPGTSDQVDVDVSVTERQTGSLLAGVGYSSDEGVVINASVSQQNIFGSGNALIVGVSTGRFDRTYSAVFTQPYYTVDGVSRTIEAYQKNLDPTGLAISQYASHTLGAALGFGVPVTESDTINFGGRVEHTEISLFSNTPPVYQQFVNEFGTNTNAFIASAGWSRDTRDDALYPTRGRLQSVLIETGLPLGDLSYYKVQYTQSTR
jgi:outer membrane protein insertion porin family